MQVVFATETDSYRHVSPTSFFRVSRIKSPVAERRSVPVFVTGDCYMIRRTSARKNEWDFVQEMGRNDFRPGTALPRSEGFVENFSLIPTFTL